ncbi:pepsin/retropepsin-like aspartic protease family protein [Chryseobacterium indologenes]|uniref:pepsin/retropepsin-like aspartic protease family protein n=1 Tax=Chryseobacterium indologenes TaxID=253 RepID=UPI001314BE8C|nr:pepsin/retropepsin-like aspartic protease family protein [Chryseobacterium indologenes]
MIHRLFLLLFLTIMITYSKAQGNAGEQVNTNAQKPLKLSDPLKNNTRESIEIPFEVDNGIIYVQAQFNGERGTFILDSGAPDLILNSDAENLVYDSSNKSEASGVGGKVKKSGTAHIQSFDWYGITLSDGDVLSVSMSHLTKRKILGLIGYRVFNDYILTFDYKKSKITGTLKTSLSQEKERNGKLLATIPFEMYKHIPVLQIEINGKMYNMGLDTGAAANLFYEKYVPELKESIIRYKESDLTGIGGKVKAKKGRVKKIIIRGVEYNKLNFIFEDATLTSLNQGSTLKLDGLLGYEFLKTYKTTIDFKAKEIRIYE